MPPSGSGTAAQSPTAQTRSRPSDSQVARRRGRGRARRAAPRACGGSGCGATPAVQTTVRVGSVSPVERRALVGCHLLQRGAEPDVDPAAAQLAQRVLGQPGIGLGQHPVGRLDQHPAHPVQARPRIALHRVGGEVLQLGQRLQARRSRRRRRRRSEAPRGGPGPRCRWRTPASRRRGCAARSRRRGS